MKYFNKKNILNEALEMTDISNSSTMKNKGEPLKTNKYFVIHHTAGESSAQGVVDILNSRGGLGIQYIIDKEGKLFKSLPTNSRGQHVSANKDVRKSGAPSDLTNDTSQGVEIVGSDDTKITLKQCKTALLLIKSLGTSKNDIYGHGEIQTNKMPTEGATCKRYVLKYWDTPEDELPTEDSEITTAQNNSDESDSNSSSSNSNSGSTNSNSTTNKSTSQGLISSFLDYFLPQKNNKTTTTTNDSNDETSDKNKEDNITEEVLRIQEIIKKII